MHQSIMNDYQVYCSLLRVKNLDGHCRSRSTSSYLLTVSGCSPPIGVQISKFSYIHNSPSLFSWFFLRLFWSFPFPINTYKRKKKNENSALHVKPEKVDRSRSSRHRHNVHNSALSLPPTRGIKSSHHRDCLSYSPFTTPHCCHSPPLLLLSMNLR